MSGTRQLPIHRASKSAAHPINFHQCLGYVAKYLGHLEGQARSWYWQNDLRTLARQRITKDGSNTIPRGSYWREGQNDALVSENIQSKKKDV